MSLSQCLKFADKGGIARSRSFSACFSWTVPHELAPLEHSELGLMEPNAEPFRGSVFGDYVQAKKNIIKWNISAANHPRRAQNEQEMSHLRNYVNTCSSLINTFSCYKSCSEQGFFKDPPDANTKFLFSSSKPFFWVPNVKKTIFGLLVLI